jgi:FkbM family methyltransferase
MNIDKIFSFIVHSKSIFIKTFANRFFYYYDKYNSKKIKKELYAFINKNYHHLDILLFDLGAAGGIDSIYQPIEKLEKFKAVGFDPDREDLSSLENGTKITYYPFAIAGKNGYRNFYITKSPGCSSLFQPNTHNLSEFPVSDYFDIVRETKIEVSTLSSFIQKTNLPFPDYLKIDVQGAELEILQSEGEWLSHVVGLSFETHMRELYCGQGLFPDAHAFLTSKGFRLISKLGRSPHFSGETLEMDVAYVRGSEFLETEEKLIKAIIFCVCHEEPTFAAHLVRCSSLTESKKSKILSFLGKNYGFPEEPQTRMMRISLNSNI